ncbi:MAG TPA: hypothetical protein P5525_07485, partial [Candidatus Paceibacterota bacterium]|nr:hypothetical protein [Candidatus Paceibacterota bacterium]
MSTTSEKRHWTVACYSLKVLLPVRGDWFCVEYAHESGKIRCFIDRVVLWGLVSKGEANERLSGLDSRGLPVSERMY